MTDTTQEAISDEMVDAAKTAFEARGIFTVEKGLRAALEAVAGRLRAQGRNQALEVVKSFVDPVTCEDIRAALSKDTPNDK